MLDDKEEFNKLQNDIYALSKDGDTKSRRVHERQEDDMHHKICALITIAAGYSIEPDNEINFNDVEGCVDVKKELRDLVGLATLRLTQPSLFRDRHYDRKRQNVIILGPPGVGEFFSLESVRNITLLLSNVIWRLGTPQARLCWGRHLQMKEVQSSFTCQAHPWLGWMFGRSGVF